MPRYEGLPAVSSWGMSKGFERLPGCLLVLVWLHGMVRHAVVLGHRLMPIY